MRPCIFTCFVMNFLLCLYTLPFTYLHKTQRHSISASKTYFGQYLKHAEGLHFSAFINPRRACAARVTVLGLCVCLSVCLSVDDYSRTTGYEAAYERYQQLQCYKGMKKNVAILLKRLRSRDMA